MTSNLGSDALATGEAGELTAAQTEAVMAAIRSHFRPEFINRLDDIVVFHPLAAEQIQQIAKIQG